MLGKVTGGYFLLLVTMIIPVLFVLMAFSF